MSHYTTRALRQGDHKGMLRPLFSVAHPDVVAATDIVDFATLEALVNTIVDLGTPQECHAHALRTMDSAEPTAAREWALDGVLGSCPHGTRFSPLEQPDLAHQGPRDYEGLMASATHVLRQAAHTIALLLEEQAPQGVAGSDVSRHAQRCLVPARLLSRLLPSLYAWLTDWTFYCAFTATWVEVAELFKTVCPKTTLYHSAAGETAATTAGTEWAMLCTLPWKPLCELLVTLTSTPRGPSYLSADPSQGRWWSEQNAQLLLEVSHQARCFFSADALTGLWEFVAPHISPSPVHANTTEWSMMILGALLPVAELSTTPLAGCRFLTGDIAADQPDKSPVLPQPHAVLNDVVQAALCASVALRNAGSESTLVPFEVVAAVTEHNVGLVSLDAYAEPHFTALLSSLKLPTSHTPPAKVRAARGAANPPASVLRCIAYGLPADTTSSLWNHLRRFLHAVEPLLRPDTAFPAHAGRVHACLSALVGSVAARLRRQHRALATRRRCARPAHPAQRTVAHWLDVPSHRWTTATADTFVALLAPVLVSALTMKLTNGARAVAQLTRLSAPVMWPHIDSFLHTALTGENSSQATLVALEVLQSTTAPLLVCAQTQVPFLAVCKAATAGVAEDLSVSEPLKTRRVLRWLAVLASLMPLKALTDSSTAAETAWVHDVVHRVLKVLRGLTELNAEARQCAADLTLFLDGASEAAFSGALDLIIAECRAESNGLFCLAVVRHCALRAPTRVLPLLEVAADTLRVPYTESRVSCLAWAKSLAANVIAGCGAHVLPSVPLVEDCLAQLLEQSDQAACVDAASELMHQLVRALTRRRCLGAGARTSLGTDEAHKTPSSPLAVEEQNGDEDIDDDNDDATEVNVAWPAVPGRTEVPLSLCSLHEATVVWQDPTEAQAACGARLLRGWIVQCVDLLRDPSRPYTGEAPARGLDALRGLQPHGEDAWRASRIMRGAVNWLAELWGMGTYLYTSTSMAALQETMKHPARAGTVVWHDAGGQPVSVPTCLDRPRWSARARAPAPPATLQALAQYPAPYTDAEIAQLLTEEVAPRFAGDVVDMARWLPRDALTGVVDIERFNALHGSAVLPSDGANSGGDGPEASTGRGVEASVPASHVGVLSEVVAFLPDLATAGFRLPGSDSSLVVLERCKVLRQVGEHGARRCRPAALFAEVAAAQEVVYYAEQHTHVFPSADARDRVFRATQLFMLTPHAAISGTSTLTFTHLCKSAVGPVRRLVAGAIATFLQRLLLVVSRLAPHTAGTELAGPLLVGGGADTPVAADIILNQGAPTSFSLSPAPDERDARALLGRLQLSVRGVVNAGLWLATAGLSDCDGETRACLFSAVLRSGTVLAKSLDTTLSAHLMHAASGHVRRDVGGYTSASAVLVEHLVRLAALDAVHAPRRAALQLAVARHYCTPTLRLFFWHRNHGEAPASHHTASSSSLPVGSPATLTLLTQLAGNDSPDISAGALALLKAQWLLFHEPEMTTFVVARVRGDGASCPMTLSSEAVPFFWKRAQTLRGAFHTADARAVSQRYLPYAISVRATPSEVRRACPGITLAEADDPFLVRCHAIDDLLRAAHEDDPTTSLLAAARTQHRVLLQTLVRQAPHTPGTGTAPEGSGPAGAAALHDSWVWRLVRLGDEKNRGGVSQHAPDQSASTFALLAVALGPTFAVPLMREVSQCALADALADAYSATDEVKAADQTNALPSTVSDKLQPLTLCTSALHAVLAALDVTAARVIEDGTPAQTTSREAAIQLLHDTVAGLCDWRHSQGATRAAIASRKRVWDSLASGEVRRTAHELFTRIEASTAWTEKNICCAFLTGLLRDPLRTVEVIELVPDMSERVQRSQAFSLAEGAAHETNTAAHLVRSVVNQGTVAMVLAPQSHHTGPCDELGQWVFAKLADALSAVEKTSAPAEDLKAHHRDDLATIQTCLTMLPFAVPHPMSLDAVQLAVREAVRALDLALPQVDTTAQVAQSALLRVVAFAAPKAVAHGTLGVLCDILRDAEAPLAATPRAKVVVAWALEEFLHANLHRLGQYVLMQRVASAAQACLAHRDDRVQTKGQAILSTLVRVATNDQVAALARTYMSELRTARAETTATAAEAEAILVDGSPGRGQATREQLSTVAALCAILLAYPADFPSFIPSVVRCLMPLADAPATQQIVRRTFRAWSNTHRPRWETVYRHAFSQAEAQELSALCNATYYA